MNGAVAITVLWTLVASLGLGFNLRGLRRARVDRAAVALEDRLALRQARRNVRAERVRVACQGFNLLVGLLALAARADVLPAPVVQLTVPVGLMLVVALLVADSIDAERHRAAIEAEGAVLLAAIDSATARPGGRRAVDKLVTPPEQDPASHQT